jgi:hypothetical protein
MVHVQKLAQQTNTLMMDLTIANLAQVVAVNAVIPQLANNVLMVRSRVMEAV